MPDEKVKRSLQATRRTLLVLLLVMAVSACSTPTAALPPTAAVLPTALPAAVAPPAAPTVSTAVPAATTKTVTDLAGRVVTIPFPPTRFASPGPADITYYSVLGVADKLVGTDARIPQPEFAVTFAKIAPTTLHIAYPFSGSDVSMEELLRAGPQFVFLPRADKRTASIEAAGIPVIQTAPNLTVAAISQLVTFYGSVFGGDAVAQAKQVTDYYAEAIAAVDSRIRTVPDAQKPRVLVMQWHGGDTYIAFGRNVWQDDAITLAGGKNVASGEIDGSRSDVSIEQILKWDPDVLILSDVNQTTAKDVLVRPGWDQLSATKNHRLYINPTGIYGFTSQVVEAFLEVQWMARTLYPDKFQDLDMHKETRHVLVDFYHYNVSDAEVDDILNATGVFHGA